MKGPVCCGRTMLACGGVIAAFDRDKEEHWRCLVCEQEIHDIHDYEVL